MPRGSGGYENEGCKSNERDAINTASLWQWAATELKRFELQTSDIDGYEGEDGDNADADVDDDALPANDGSMQNVEDWRHFWFDMGTSDANG